MVDAVKLQAARDSVDAWRKKLLAENPNDIETGVKACPLCRLYFNDDCDGCPIKEYTGEEDCENTPYHDAAEALAVWRDVYGNVSSRKFAPGYEQRWRDAANKEITFLENIVVIVEGQQA